MYSALKEILLTWQVFSKADIWFSSDGETYEDGPLLYSYIPDCVLENARNVSIGLHGRRGRLLKVHLYFAARWIIISEVTFDASKSLVEHLPLVLIIHVNCYITFSQRCVAVASKEQFVTFR